MLRHANRDETDRQVDGQTNRYRHIVHGQTGRQTDRRALSPV